LHRRSNSSELFLYSRNENILKELVNRRNIGVTDFQTKHSFD